MTETKRYCGSTDVVDAEKKGDIAIVSAAASDDNSYSSLAYRDPSGGRVGLIAQKFMGMLAKWGIETQGYVCSSQSSFMRCTQVEPLYYLMAVDHV